MSMTNERGEVLKIAMIGMSDSRMGRFGSTISGSIHVSCYRDIAEWDQVTEGEDALVLCGGFGSLETLWEAVEHLGARWPDARLVIWLERGDPLLEHRQKIQRYVVSHGLQFWEAASVMEGWDTLYQRLSSEDIMASDRLKRGVVVVFQGVTPNIGTTVASFSSAVQLSHEFSGEVAYVCLNLKSSKLHHYCGIEPAITLDGLRAELKAGALTAERLRSSCSHMAQTPRLSVLFGNQLREQAEYYMVEDISLLLDRCRQAFDVTVVEVSAYWDNAAVFAAMREADMRVLVSSDRLGSFQEDFRRSALPMLGALGIGQEELELLVVHTGTPGYGLSAIRKQTGLPVIGSLPYDPDAASSLDQGRLQEFASARETSISNSCAGVARLMAHAGQLAPLVKEQPVRRWWQRRVFPAAGR